MAEELGESRLSNANDLWRHLHYNMMLAIARQPNRLADALAYRSTHRALIEIGEQDCGTLESHLAKDEEERQVYNEAVKLVKSDANRTGPWWTEHADALSRATRRYGPLEDGTPASEKSPVLAAASSPRRRNRKFLSMTAFQKAIQTRKRDEDGSVDEP